LAFKLLQDTAEIAGSAETRVACSSVARLNTPSSAHCSLTSNHGSWAHAPGGGGSGAEARSAQDVNHPAAMLAAAPAPPARSAGTRAWPRWSPPTAITCALQRQPLCPSAQDRSLCVTCSPLIRYQVGNLSHSSDQHFGWTKCHRWTFSTRRSENRGQTKCCHWRGVMAPQLCMLAPYILTRSPWRTSTSNSCWSRASC
jgi:hypothetical protein